MKKLIILLLILIYARAAFAAPLTTDAIDALAKSMYDNRMKTASEEGRDLKKPFYNGHVFIYQGHVIVYIPYLDKWAYVKASDLKDTAVASD